MIKLITLGGISAEPPLSAIDFNRRLARRCINSGLERGVVVWWQHLLEQRQQQHLKSLPRKTLGHKLFVNFAGDIVGTTINSKGKDELTAQIYSRLDYEVSLAKYDRFVFIGHSLGSVILSNYIWDRFNNRDDVAFITMGSPLALWTLAYPDHGAPVDVAKWVNFYSPEDPVSSPLQNLSPRYQAVVEEDVPVRSLTTTLGSYLPLVNLAAGLRAHSLYWTHNTVLNTIKDLITNPDSWV